MGRLTLKAGQMIEELEILDLLELWKKAGNTNGIEIYKLSVNFFILL